MTKKILKISLIVFLAFAVFGIINQKNKKNDDIENTSSTNEHISQSTGQAIVIGLEYAVLGQDANLFGTLGIGAIKPLPETINWSKMQPDLAKVINYADLDQFVEKYQNAGFQEIVVGLRTLSHSEDNGATHGKNRPVPKPEHIQKYVDWVGGVVERYDKDGIEDMPGLKYPVRYYEIEVEFSSYTPESVKEYLKKLEIAYKAAHDAYDDVLIAHSAFLTATAFDSNPTAGQYEKAFASMSIPDKHHGLADMRKILDNPELFDLLNFHALEDPIMIERTLAWLKYETDQRGYSKPIIISDTVPTPFVSYGRATACTGPFLGIMVWPAKESDRCRLADYFNKILDNDVATIKWKNWYLATDIVKKTIIAAAGGVKLINTSFTDDLPILNSKLGFASAGNAGFGGITSEKYNFLTKQYKITEYRPGFYALKQLAEKLNNISNIKQLPSDKNVYLYEIQNAKEKFWIGWLHPDYLILPGDTEPSQLISLDIKSDVKTIQMAQTAKEETEIIHIKNGKIDIVLTMTPVYVYILKK